MKKLLYVLFVGLLLESCDSSPKEDKDRLQLLKETYDEKWAFCNRALYAQEKMVVENGGRQADSIVFKESLYYRDSTLQYLEKGKINLARNFVVKGLESKKLNAGRLILQIGKLDSAYVHHKDSTSLLYAELSIVSGLSRIIQDNAAKLGTGF